MNSKVILMQVQYTGVWIIPALLIDTLRINQLVKAPYFIIKRRKKKKNEFKKLTLAI